MSPGMSGTSLYRDFGFTTSLTDPHLGGANHGVDFSIVFLNPWMIWRLLDPNESTSSRAQATLVFAITLVHEMMHAIWRTKNLFAPIAEVNTDEPFYAPPGTRPQDSAWLSELGLSWEQSIINGTVVERPADRETVGGLYIFSGDVPNEGLARAYMTGIDLASHEHDIWYGYAIPPFVSQLYGSDEFWQTHVVKYGLPALHLPKLLRTMMQHSRAQRVEICQLEYVLPEFRTRLRQTADRFTTRKNELIVLRPWYFHKKREWSHTVYSRTWLRNLAGRFRVAFRKGDEWEGQACYKDLKAHAQWGEIFNANGFLLDQDEDWIDQAVGYLMMVIMPSKQLHHINLYPFENRQPLSVPYDSNAY